MSDNIPTHSNLDWEQRFDLVTRGLGRVDAVDLELIGALLREKENPSIFWGVAPTGRPHIGYLVAFVKIAELVEAGVQVKVLLADLYAFLVNYRYPRSLVGYRAEYYKYALSAVFEAILGLPASSIQFKRETSYEADPEFLKSFYELLSVTSQAAARSPNDELRNTKMLSPLICTLVQALDDVFMGCDFQLGGLDQAEYYTYADEYLPKIGHERKYPRMMNPMLPGLTGTKMSASDPKSKIDLIDPPETVSQKILNAVCQTDVVQDNPILALLKIILLPISRLRLAHSARENNTIATYPPFIIGDAPEGSLFSVKSETGQCQHYKSYEEIELDFLSGKLTPESLKDAVAKAINQLLHPIRQSYEQNPQWQAVLKIAYPESDGDVEPAATSDASERFCIPAALREISNEKVKLVPFNSNLHAAEFIKMAEKYPEIWTHGPFGPFDSAQSFTSDFIEAFVRPKTDMVLYTVIDKTGSRGAADRDGAMAGLIAYLNTSPTFLRTEIGFVITLPPFQRTHVTSNAVGLLLNLALNSPDEGGLGLRRVQWVTSSVNHKSIKTAERMGFLKEGVLRWDMVYAGGEARGKQSNGKSLQSQGKASHINEVDLGRDSVVFGMCWDDWFLEGKRELVAQRMAA